MNSEDKEFIEKLNNCTTKSEIESIIEEIDEDDVYLAISDKYKQILEFNKDENVKSIKKILEFKYMEIRK